MILVKVTGRGGGKTHTLLDWMELAPEGEIRVCMCPTRDALRTIWEDVRRQGRLGLERSQFGRPDDFRGRSWPGKRVVVGFDNAEKILEALVLGNLGLRHEVGLVTIEGMPL